MKEIDYPFDAQYMMRKRRAIKKELLDNDKLIEKRIAILGGSTTHDIKDMLELFLLNYGIKPIFFESEYAQYWQDAMFDNPQIRELNPDIIFIHTTVRNITFWPEISNSKEEVNTSLERQLSHFSAIWDKLAETYHCQIIQNNFEYPCFRLMGNMDASDYRGRINFVTRLNLEFYNYAQNHKNFFINDINYQ